VKLFYTTTLNESSLRQGRLLLFPSRRLLFLESNFNQFYF